MPTPGDLIRYLMSASRVGSTRPSPSTGETGGQPPLTGDTPTQDYSPGLIFARLKEGGAPAIGSVLARESGSDTASEVAFRPRGRGLFNLNLPA